MLNVAIELMTDPSSLSMYMSSVCTYIHTYVHGVHREKDWHNYSSMVTVSDAFMQNTSPAQSVELGHLTLYIEEGMHVGSLGNMHEPGS